MDMSWVFLLIRGVCFVDNPFRTFLRQRLPFFHCFGKLAVETVHDPHIERGKARAQIQMLAGTYGCRESTAENMACIGEFQWYGNALVVTMLELNVDVVISRSKEEEGAEKKVGEIHGFDYFG